MEEIVKFKDTILGINFSGFFDYLIKESSNVLFLTGKILEELLSRSILFYPQINIWFFGFFLLLAAPLIFSALFKSIFTKEKNRKNILKNLKKIVVAFFIILIPVSIFTAGTVVRGLAKYDLAKYIKEKQSETTHENLKKIEAKIQKRENEIIRDNLLDFTSEAQKASHINRNTEEILEIKKGMTDRAFAEQILNAVVIDRNATTFALKKNLNIESENPLFCSILDIYFKNDFQKDISFGFIKKSPIMKELDPLFPKKTRNFLWAEKYFKKWKEDLMADKEEIKKLKKSIQAEVQNLEKEAVKKQKISFLGLANYARNFLVNEEIKDTSLWTFFNSREKLVLDNFFGVLGFFSLCFLGITFAWRVFYVYFSLITLPLNAIKLSKKKSFYIEPFLKKIENFIFYLISPAISIFILMTLSIFTVEIIKSPFFVLIFLTVSIFITHDAFMHFMKKKIKRENMVAFWKYRLMPKVFDIAGKLHIKITGKEIVEDRVEVLSDGLKVHDHLKEKFKIAKEKAKEEAQKKELNAENYIRNKTHLHTVVDEIVDSNLDEHSKRMRKELSNAGKIQNAVLDVKLPKISGLDIFIKSNPASEIGGDCYDFIELNSNKFIFYVGDATGHGAPAALVVSSTSTLIQTYAEVYQDHADALKEILVQSNKILHKKTTPDMFITLLACKWDERDKKFSYVSAGHERIILFKAKEQKVELLPPAGMALGMLPEINNILKEEAIDLEEGDVMAIYSDGIPEAKTRSDENEMYGMMRFQRTFEMSCKADGTAGDIYDDVLTDLNDFTEGEPQADDVTLMVVKRTDSAVDEPTAEGTEEIVKEIPKETPEEEKRIQEVEKEIIKSPVISANSVTEEANNKEEVPNEENLEEIKKEEECDNEDEEDDEDELKLGQVQTHHVEPEENTELPKIKMPTELLKKKEEVSTAESPEGGSSVGEVSAEGISANEEIGNENQSS